MRHDIFSDMSEYKHQIIFERKSERIKAYESDRKRVCSRKGKGADGFPYLLCGGERSGKSMAGCPWDGQGSRGGRKSDSGASGGLNAC